MTERWYEARADPIIDAQLPGVLEGWPKGSEVTVDDLRFIARAFGYDHLADADGMDIAAALARMHIPVANKGDRRDKRYIVRRHETGERRR